ncbi:hypothetical protein JTE90_023832 [Oedothorax gibbosus]|uniref:Uncharacterized protein n=1 Tax=Oedothorax gibbosus TaxID=931172 RepID=A0AAV6VK76_9ARAC|nr:hypothetical protein JTE90_023832 [Oedothorax gibbosus]
MAGAAGRRNILREITALGDQAGGGNSQGASTPTSPEEAVIRERGYHRKSATYTFDAPDPVFFKSPTKSPKRTFHNRLLTPTKTPVRSSPRKRVATPDNLQFNEELAEMSLSSKRPKKEVFQNVKPSTQFEKGLKALSHAQLVTLVSSAAQKSPEIMQVISDLVPAVPDLSPIEQRLYMLQRNIYRAFPRNLYGSQDGSFCYIRVRTHLEAFRKECLETCDQLMKSHHWPAIFEYIVMAWKFTDGLPNWESAIHNKIKSVCMKQLASHCISAMKAADLDKPALTELIERMQCCSKETPVITCVNFAKDLLNKV